MKKHYYSVIVIIFHIISTSMYAKIKADAGNDIISSDNSYQVTLNAKLPEGYKGTWRLISGDSGIIEDISNPNSLFYGKPCTKYQLEWKIKSIKDSALDIVNVVFYEDTDDPFPGNDIIITSGNIAVTLNATAPLSGVGKWTVMDGEGGEVADSLNPSSLFIGKPCSKYILKWSISSRCTTKESFININLQEIPSEAIIEKKMYVSDCYGRAELKADYPSIGRGYWSCSDPSGFFDNPTDPITIFKGSKNQSYTVSWTVKTQCDSSIAYTTIQTLPDYPVAYAGEDQIIENGKDTAYLDANYFQDSQGQWTIVSGKNGKISNINNPNAYLIGETGETYILKWTLKTPCEITEDYIKIIFETFTKTD